MFKDYDDQPAISTDDYDALVAMMVETNSGTVIDGRPPRKPFTNEDARKRKMRNRRKYTH